VLGVSSAIFFRALVLIFIKLTTIRSLVPDIAAVVTLPFELSSGIATCIAVAITRHVFLGTLISSMPLLLTGVTGASKGGHHHFTTIIYCMFLLDYASLSPQLINGIL
jgi:hypothetical protein